MTTGIKVVLLKSRRCVPVEFTKFTNALRYNMISDTEYIILGFNGT